MKAFEKYIKRIRENNIANFSKSFPQHHLIIASALGVCLIIITALPSEKADAKRHVQAIEIPQIAFVEPQEEVLVTEINQSISSEHKKVDEKVRSGDNLSAIFKRVGLSDKHLMRLLQNSENNKQLTSLYPGHKLEFYISDNGELAQLNYIKSQLESVTYSLKGDAYQFRSISRKPDIHLATAQGTVKTSLYEAGLKARLNDKLIMELAEIFGWDIDFALDLRQGDSFKVVYEEKFLDGEKIGNGSIIAAEFINQKETFQAARYTHKNGDTSYYTPEGKSMRKAFLRAPLDFRRISSNFNPKRLHPIYKTVRPHRGIDYAASRGTPVWASGNGRVIASSYTKANGNYVVIQHGNNIQTKYLHLHKRHVKKGQKVKQKQKIGTVGSTGYSTAPHLHYEFVINGVHRNPRTILNKLPKAQSIAKKELADFKLQVAPKLAELNKHSAVSHASASP